MVYRESRVTGSLLEGECDMKRLLQFLICIFIGFSLAGALLVVLMFLQQFDAIQWWSATGKPLAWLALNIVPDATWSALSGVEDAVTNPRLQSFLQFAAALAQVAVLSGVIIFYGVCRR